MERGKNLMKNQKLLTAVAGVVMLASLTGCGGSSKKEVAVFIPGADHGWSGAVVDYAQTRVDELNKSQDKFTYKLYKHDSSEAQANGVNDVLATNNVAGIVINPYDNTAEATITKIAKSGVKFSMFDRIISNETIDGDEDYVSKVYGDNVSIGTAVAKYYVEDGLTTSDKVLVIPGDNSSVPEQRTKGFTDYLLAHGWTQDQIRANVVSTDYTGWSRDTSIRLFTDWISKDITGYKYIFTHDDEIAVGIMEALAGTTIAEDKKAAFKNQIKGINGAGGLEELFQIMRGDHPRSATYNTLIGSDCHLIDATYDPAMIVEAINDMDNKLNGKTVTQDHVIASEILTKESVQNKTGFGGKVA